MVVYRNQWLGFFAPRVNWHYPMVRVCCIKGCIWPSVMSRFRTLDNFLFNYIYLIIIRIIPLSTFDTLYIYMHFKESCPFNINYINDNIISYIFTSIRLVRLINIIMYTILITIHYFNNISIIYIYTHIIVL